MIKTILGYQIEPGVSEEEYEDWLFNVHALDILANPFVDNLVFNKVLRPVPFASGGTPVHQALSLYRIAEMHFADEQAYANYLQWFEDHPVPAERSPAGRTAFKFYVMTSAQEFRPDTLPPTRRRESGEPDENLFPEAHHRGPAPRAR